MTDELVEPRWKKPRKRSPQQQRRAEWLKEFDAAKKAVALRSLGWCEVAGCDRQSVMVHHKAGRSVPGANDPDRLVDICLHCHERVHANPEWSYENGYMERRT